MNLFTYGTLMVPEIMTQVSGSQYLSQKATIFNYVRKTVSGEVYPAIIKQKGGVVEGMLYFNLSKEAFERLDKFEGPLYERTETKAVCKDGKHVVTYTYVITPNFAHQLSDDNWNYENFLTNHKNLFQGSYNGWDKIS